MKTYPVQCQKADGRPYTIEIPAADADSAYRHAESIGHHVLGTVDANGGTPKASPPDVGASTTALALSWFGFLCPLLAMVGIAIGAGQKHPRGKTAIAIGVLAIVVWTVGGIGYAVQASHRAESNDDAYRRLRTQIDAIGK